MASDFVQLDLLSWTPVAIDPMSAVRGVSWIDTAYYPIRKALMNDSICKTWRTCPHGTVCMDDTINTDCVCYQDEPHLLPVIHRSHPDPAINRLMTYGFSRDEAKVLHGGFHLVRYTRDEKKLELSEADHCNGWLALEPFPTYAAAERKLKELKTAGNIETDLKGKIIMTGWNQPGGLLKAGFEFYRVYGLRAYEENFCIKQGSKNWSNWKKCATREELQAAWNELMNNDLKALEG